MTDLEKLIQLRSQIYDRLLEITTSPKPSYSIDGQSFSWTEYFNALTEKAAKLDEMIAAKQGPIFEITQGFT